MWDYIVLGEVPGTQIQVSFEMYVLLLGIAGLIIGYIRMRRQIRRFMLMSLISWTIRLRNPRQLPHPSTA